MLSHDIRDADGLGLKLKSEFSVDPTCPTFVMTECLLIYLQNADSERILKWLASFFGQSPYLAILNYEMITPHDSFGQTMIHNLMDRGCDLLGIEGCPSIASQIDRMNTCLSGKQLKVECLEMDKVYSQKLDAAEKARIEKLEIFDEFEEWILL